MFNRSTAQPLLHRAPTDPHGPRRERSGLGTTQQRTFAATTVALTVSLGLLGGCDEVRTNAMRKAPAHDPWARLFDGEGASTQSPGAAPGPRVNVRKLAKRLRPFFSELPAAAPNPANPTSAAKVTLGRMLFFDTRLSKNHDVSCNTCHDLSNFGVDVRESNGKRDSTSLGHRGQRGDRNSPTVYNAALNFSQFWDGRAADVEAQAKGPVLNPIEMAMPDETSVVAVLKSIPDYEAPFAAAFPGEGVTYDNMAKAIGAFERELLTPAPFDAFLGGDLKALTTAQALGLKLFLEVGCTECHTGALVGGNKYQKLGSTKPWPGLHDKGRFAVTKDKRDISVFKVASLRNITKTGPYLHDGSVDDLTQTVSMMAEHQTARGALPPEDAAAIAVFLESLTGEIPLALIAQPQLPPSGPTTPAPDPA